MLSARRLPTQSIFFKSLFKVITSPTHYPNYRSRAGFRVAHVAPTKVSQFVTLWKRDATGGPIKRFDLADDIDFVVINVQSGSNNGQFIFPKMVLFEKGIFSKDGKGGERAFRIYPSWNIADNAQGKKSQAWQYNYFFLIRLDKPINMARVKKFYLL